MTVSDLVSLHSLPTVVKIIFTIISALFFLGISYLFWVPPKNSNHTRPSIEYTRSDFSKLFKDITGIQIDRTVINKQISLLLHEDSFNELQPYIDKGWITLQSNGNIAIGSGAKVQGSIRDQKRNYGTAEGFWAVIYESYFD